MTTERITYEALVATGAAQLKPNEWWCIEHPDGVLEQTASKDFTEPVRIACEALNMDWDDLTEQGFHLSQVTLPCAQK